MASRFCRICKDWHDLAEAWPFECRGHFPPPPHRTINVISDNLDYTLNMADGRRYSSKAAYYRAVKNAGCEIVGNDTGTASPQKTLDDPVIDIKRAVEQHSSRATARRKRAHA